LTLSFLSITRLAIREEKDKNCARAFNLYSKALELTLDISSKVKLIARKGSCLESVGNHKEAEDLMLSLVDLYSDHPESYLQTALYFMKIQDFKLAKQYLRTGIEKFPEFLEFYLTLSYILRETERANESIEILKKALMQENLSNGKGGISRKDIWAELGNLYFERGSYNSCIVCLKKALRLEEKELFLFYDILSISHLKLGDPHSALNYINLHLQYFEERDPESYIIKARILSRLNDKEGAEENLLMAYNQEGVLTLKTEELRDFSSLVQDGFFESLENFIVEDEL
jgi:tetratricopeptide (TPR) repeat protein